MLDRSIQGELGKGPRQGEAFCLHKKASVDASEEVTAGVKFAGGANLERLSNTVIEGCEPEFSGYLQ